ncbi:MAG: hypothetical protein KAJ88_00730 [Candidatus Aenigmarchaeota archaeon]|nr:hypothetical protein [Candidatus Aenigmarchaeota archaeon]
MKKFKKQNDDDRSGLFIPAGLFIGMGIGFIIEQLIGGMFLGLGLGFLGMAITKTKKKQTKHPQK